jgi:NhaA family Na+:H+ antiporter
VSEGPESRHHPEIRLPWSRSDRPVPRLILRPLQEFLDASLSSVVLLVAAVALALVWANSPWSSSYEWLFSTELSIEVGRFAVVGDLRFWIDEGLMALFFLVAGLEIKREITAGELRGRAVVLPIVAAIAGMAVPAVLFLAIVGGGPGAEGWGIPMATDVAFALAVLALAGAVPRGLRPLLLALAIVDDIGSVVVVTLFYAGVIDLVWLLATGAVALSFVVLPRIHVRASILYVALGVLLWYAMYRAGLHPALAGVVVGLLTPSVPFQRPRAVSAEAHRTADLTEDDPEPPDADARHWLRLAELSREAVSPLTRVEHTLLPWTSFVVLPLFALANMGVTVSATSIAAAGASVFVWAIVSSRIAGKIVGIWGGTTIARRAGSVDLPAGVGSTHLVGLGAAAGTGFTVSLYVAEVAFPPGHPLLAEAKIGLLAASVASAFLGILVLRRADRRRALAGGATEAT